MGPLFTRFATAVSGLIGHPATFVAAAFAVCVWGLSGPLFDYGETWQLVINTSTTIVTFLMIFILQNSQNRDGRALQAKLDELILSGSAENKFIGIEKLDEKEISRLKDHLENQCDDRDDEKSIGNVVLRNGTKEQDDEQSFT
ncbi:low affinity iron permease family protein [Rhizobium sp. KVB221]|uniref:Low affinity iron permease family protein n=1 Tax=Rhizobium setariae TaxID=2801340 RepID=A0A936YWU6_9HYPH|nr:low affinity iron permease family protein [Rhizobium setariae]MBL0375477.1 low affinity iron permease family protein [Rhizobium setariae]